MKKVLVTGASGAIGVQVVKYLLSEGRYEITILDLKNKCSIQRLKKFRRRVNVIYGDATNRVLMEALVKDHDYIIHLASAMPPLADMKKNLATMVDFNSCENIVRAINYYNPKCHLFFASTTSMYKDKKEPSVKSRLELNELDYFANAKLECEKLIKEKIKNYTIYRIPLVLSNPLSDNFMYHVNKKSIIDVITKEDAAYAFVKGIKYSDKLNKKTFNLGMDETIKYQDLLNELFKINGLSFRCLLNRLFVEKDYYSPVTSDKDDLEEIIKYRNDSLATYFRRQKSRVGNRKIAKFLAKPFIKKVR